MRIELFLDIHEERIVVEPECVVDPELGEGAGFVARSDEAVGRQSDQRSLGRYDGPVVDAPGPRQGRRVQLRLREEPFVGEQRG